MGDAAMQYNVAITVVCFGLQHSPASQNFTITLLFHSIIPLLPHSNG